MELTNPLQSFRRSGRARPSYIRLWRRCLELMSQVASLRMEWGGKGSVSTVKSRVTVLVQVSNICSAGGSFEPLISVLHQKLQQSHNYIGVLFKIERGQEYF